MALTNREQKIVILTVIALSVLIIDRYVLSPVLAKRSEISQHKVDLQSRLDESLALLQRAKNLRSRWQTMRSSGLTYDIQETESKVLRFIEKSSQNSGFSLSSIQPDHLPQKEKFGTIELMLSGSGSMQSVTEFLWNIETADVPLKIESMQLGANNEDADVMSLQLQLSSIYLIKTRQETK